MTAWTLNTHNGIKLSFPNETIAKERAQIMANRTGQTIGVVWEGADERTELMILVRPQSPRRAVSKRIDSRMDDLIASGFTVEGAARIIANENTKKMSPSFTAHD